MALHRRLRAPSSPFLHLVFAVSVITAAVAPSRVNARFFYVRLTRFTGRVNTVCLDNNDTRGPTTFDNANVMLVGPKSRLTAGGRSLCVAWPTLVLATGSRGLPFIPLPALPGVIANSSFVSSIWHATSPSDIVAFAAENDVPDRPLTVDGTPVPVDLAPADAVELSEATLPPAPASSFNVTVELMSEVDNYLSRYYTIMPYARGVKAAAIVKYVPDSDDGEFNVAYVIFQRNMRDGSISAAVLSVSYVEDDDSPIVSLPGGSGSGNGGESGAGGSGGSGGNGGKSGGNDDGVDQSGSGSTAGLAAGAGGASSSTNSSSSSTSSTTSTIITSSKGGGRRLLSTFRLMQLEQQASSAGRSSTSSSSKRAGGAHKNKSNMLAGVGRSLLQYGYGGGVDRAPVAASSRTCVLIFPIPPGCLPGAPNYPICRFRCTFQ